MQRYKHGQYAEFVYDPDEIDSLSETVQIEEVISDDEIVIRFLNSDDTITVSADRLGMPFGTPCEH